MVTCDATGSAYENRPTGAAVLYGRRKQQIKFPAGCSSSRPTQFKAGGFLQNPAVAGQAVLMARGPRPAASPHGEVKRREMTKKSVRRGLSPSPPVYSAFNKKVAVQNKSDRGNGLHHPFSVPMFMLMRMRGVLDPPSNLIIAPRPLKILAQHQPPWCRDWSVHASHRPM